MTRPDMPPVTLSRNETESLALKAARGAGLSWGLAEEAGAAAGWLAAQGLDGLPTLLALLTTPDRAGPVPAPGHWTSTTSAPLCPIETGAALLDRARIAAGPFTRETRLAPLAFPLLLLPFIARAAALLDRPLALVLPGGSLAISATGGVDATLAEKCLGVPVLALSVAPAKGTLARSSSWSGPSPALPAVDPACLSRLEALALATTVPASASSRGGAGSDLSDND